MANTNEQNKTKANAPKPTVAELEASLKLIEEEVVDLREENASLQAKVAELSQKTIAKAAKEGTLKLPTVKVGNDSYQFVYPKIKLGGTVYTAEEISENEELITRLIELKSGAIKAL
ncbi:MAG: hypothetical protein AAFU67_04035 [Bacteroidota bacterium]